MTEKQKLAEALKRETAFDAEFYAEHGVHRCAIWLEAARALTPCGNEGETRNCKACNGQGGVTDEWNECLEGLSARACGRVFDISHETAAQWTKGISSGHIVAGKVE